MITLIQMARKIKQKILFSQICEFLESRHCTGSKESHKEWLFELTNHTNAREVRSITFSDLECFTNYVLGTESSEYRRLEASKVIRKFLHFCKMKGYIYTYPDNTLHPPTEGDRINFMKSILKKTGPMPDVEMIKKVRYLYNVHRLSFTKIAEKLEQETGKKYYRNNIWRWYHSNRI